MRSMNIQRLITRSRLCLLGLLGLTLFSSPVSGQVFDSGPSDSELFTLVVNSPPTPGVFSSFGNGLLQLNIFDGGLIGTDIEANQGGEVNIFGGSLGLNFDANFGSEVNISGGTIGLNFDADDGSVVNITGGFFDRFLEASSGSEMNISGGTLGRGFTVRPGSDVELIGGEFELNGTPFSGPSVSVNVGEVFSGTLADGSTFILSFLETDLLDTSISLTSVELPTLDLSPVVVATANPVRPSGLRAGQTLTLVGGGELGEGFEAIDATLNVEGGMLGFGLSALRSEVNISGGSVGGLFVAHSGSEVNISGGVVGRNFDATSGSVVNISGGELGVFFEAMSGSEVNISGGSFGDFFEAGAGSEVNLFGSNFMLDGVPLDDSLTIGEALTIDSRDVILTGIFADGSPFSFVLDPGLVVSDNDIFDPNATLTVTLGPPVPSNIILGDVNQDGVVDFEDIPAFIAVLQAGEFQVEADTDENGVVDFSDISSFIAILIAA